MRDFEKKYISFILKEKIHKINLLLTEFKKSIIMLNDDVSLKLFEISIKISEFIVSDVLLVDKFLVLRKISMILKKVKNSMENLIIKVHSKNEFLVKKKFSAFFQSYDWKILIDNTLDQYSCYVIIDNMEIDGTISAIWNSVYELSGITKDKKDDN
ncbi:FliH/SctL family protein [Buchnera aphidicola]|uniref:FliH/SctL family protein n=1 Tax=Buchnera aphidicola TaxID=9 RepID=UPI0031B6CC8F